MGSQGRGGTLSGKRIEFGFGFRLTLSYEKDSTRGLRASVMDFVVLGFIIRILMVSIFVVFFLSCSWMGGVDWYE